MLFVPPAYADRVADWQPIIAEAALRFGIPTPWIARVIRAESGGYTMMNGQPIRSRAGAMGLMQLMPATWDAMRAALGLGIDPHDPHDNIIAGTAYLRAMYDRFGYPGLFAAYNAGPGRYAAYLGGTATLPGETSIYLATVADRAGTGQRRAASTQRLSSTPSNSLFALRRAPEQRNDPISGDAPRDTLFVALSHP